MSYNVYYAREYTLPGGKENTHMPVLFEHTPTGEVHEAPIELAYVDNISSYSCYISDARMKFQFRWRFSTKLWDDEERILFTFIELPLLGTYQVTVTYIDTVNPICVEDFYFDTTAFIKPRITTEPISGNNNFRLASFSGDKDITYEVQGEQEEVLQYVYFRFLSPSALMPPVPSSIQIFRRYLNPLVA